MSSFRLLLRVIPLALLALALAACGNKGPLVKPAPSTPASQPASPVPDIPAP